MHPQPHCFWFFRLWEIFITQNPKQRFLGHPWIWPRQKSWVYAARGFPWFSNLFSAANTLGRDGQSTTVAVRLWLVELCCVTHWQVRQPMLICSLSDTQLIQLSAVPCHQQALFCCQPTLPGWACHMESGRFVSSTPVHWQNAGTL